MHRPPRQKYTPKAHVLMEYDLKLLVEARQLIWKVYEYHYGDSQMRKQVSRLETIINKIDELKNL